MKKDILIGRVEEIEILKSYQDSPKSEFVAVYGRRRVGKTFLVRETLGKLFDFEFIGLYETPASVQRAEFQKVINKSGKISKPIPQNWFDAFDNLKEYLLSLKKDKVTVFIDELPWMDTNKSNFRTALSSFWNGWENGKTIIKLYVCGSATTWMVDKLIGDRGGLYGRITRPIYLAPFTLSETGQYLNTVKKMGYGKKQILDVYMVFGGIPYYLDMFDKKLPLTVNVDRLLFSDNAPLRNEYDFLFRSLFKDSVNYRKVIEVLSRKLSGLTREDISRETGLTGGELSKILSNLTSCDFIRNYVAPKKKERNQMYQLTDMFSLFFLKFVKNAPRQDEQFRTAMINSGKRNAWSGYAFEQVCLHHIFQIKKKLGITGILSNVYAWSRKAFTDSDGGHWDGGQIDLIIDRSDGVMNLCEMKYSNGEFSIDKKYEKTLRDRINMFRYSERTGKDLRLTFVTTFGVKHNEHKGIVDNEITLEDMFE